MNTSYVFVCLVLEVELPGKETRVNFSKLMIFIGSAVLPEKEVVFSAPWMPFLSSFSEVHQAEFTLLADCLSRRVVHDPFPLDV